MESKSINILDEKVMNLMRRYDAGYDAGDWARMDRMLDMIPKSSSYSISDPKFGKIGVIVASVLLGSFLIYKVIDVSTNKTAETIQTAPEPEKEITPATPEPPAPKAAFSDVKPEDTANKAIINMPGQVVTPAPPIVTSPPPAPAVEGKKEVTEEKKIKPTTVESAVPKEKTEDIHPTVHKEATTQKDENATESKPKGTRNVGLSGLLKLNADSLKKQNEQIKNDTVK